MSAPKIIKSGKRIKSYNVFSRYFTKWDRKKIPASVTDKLQLFETKFTVDVHDSVMMQQLEIQTQLKKHIEKIIDACIFNGVEQLIVTGNNKEIYKMAGLYTLCDSRKNKGLTFIYNPAKYLKIEMLRFANLSKLTKFDDALLFDEYRIITELKIVKR